MKYLRPIPVLLLFLLCSIVAACGPNARQRTMTTALVGLNATADAFVAFDDDHQAGIVDGATSLEQGQAALTEYRTDRQKVIDAISSAYQALAIAAILDDDPKTLEAAIAAVGRAQKLIATIRGNE